jgi:predicted dithiol-disulfide oxidoreductase (DUF899 family)
MPSETNDDLRRELAEAEEELLKVRARLGELRRNRKPEPFVDHRLLDREGGPVRLSDLFGEHDDLMVVHNMGAQCPYCTLWADGFDGVLDHLESRTAFAVISPDPPETQRAFAESRGWRFPMFSAHGLPFSRDTGFETENGSPMPGVSTYRRDEEGRILLVQSAFFGPRDDFCAVWHLFDLLPDGPAGWQPKLSY